MKRFTATGIILLGFLAGLSAQSVTREMAATVARNFCFEKFNQYVRPMDFSLVNIREDLHWNEENQTLLYIFNMYPAGFVIVSGHRAMPPVLAYSCEHPYRIVDQPPNVQYWIGMYAAQVKLAYDSYLQSGKDIAACWDRYLDPGFLLRDPAPAQTTAGPLLTSLWNQGWPYNYYCPETTTGGSGGHVWAGCVATACQQIMYYYRWPDYGAGKKSYIPLSHPEYGVQSADFGNTRYRFEEMADDPLTINLAIAEYLYHCGVAFEMDYDPDGSAPTEYDSVAFFFKCLDFEFLSRVNYTDSAWIAMLRYYIDHGMPVFYMGDPSSGPGHAFVCDGYQDSLFHFNLGWGGTSNGYYLIDNVVGYNFDQEISVPTFPDTILYTWPQFFAMIDTLTAMEGSITDGSGPIHDYQNNIQYHWLIDPQTNEDSVSYIKLFIRRFSTAGQGDHLVIYDGGDVSAPILADLWGDTIPATLTSSGNQVMLVFTTDAAGTGPGFLIDYLAKEPDYCKGTEVVTDSSRHISDGSGRFHYHNSSICKWRLEPEGCDSTLTLHFNWFDTEPEHDYLEIYDPETQELLARYSGYYSDPPEPVTSPSGKMFLVFSTNSNIAAHGWEARYGDVTRTDAMHAVRELMIIPNPASDQIRIDYTLDLPASVRMEVMNVLGEIVTQVEPEKQYPGRHSFILNISDLSSGLYLCRIHAGLYPVVKRLIKP